MSITAQTKATIQAAPLHDSKAENPASGNHTALLVVVFFAAVSYLILRVPDADFLLSSTDQGYQMALGMAVAKGRMPGFDFITQYGPGVAFASYLGFALTGNVVGEMLLSAIGYATAVTIATSVVGRSAGRIPAILVAICMLLWFPRFYKWYYCLFPLTGLVFARSYYTVTTEGRRHVALLVIWSQFVGLAGLFRYDLGLEGAVFGVLAILATHYAMGWARRRTAAGDIFQFVCGSLILPSIIMAAIFAARGTAQLLMFMRSIRDGAVDTVDFYGIPPFQFDHADVLSPGNALALLQIIVPITCLLGGVVGILSLRSDSRATAADGFILLCSSLVGLGVYPQSLHRADLQHILQVAYPFFVTFALLCVRFIVKSRPRPRLLAFAGDAAVTITIAVMLALRPEAGVDLGSLFRNPVHQWRSLASLPESRAGNPIADMAVALRRLTPGGASVFLVMAPTDMALLFFAQRYQAGIFPVYESGMFASHFWIQQNRAALDSSPPDYLVVLQTPDSNPAPFMPDLLREWRKQFKITLYENGRYKLLAKP